MFTSSNHKSVRSIGSSPSLASASEAHYQYRQDQAMTPEQCTQVFEAILEGKYSWACVLILKFAGYNPLHYIPYRTYRRLLKENSSKSRSQEIQVASGPIEADRQSVGYASAGYLTSLQREQSTDRPQALIV